jgi:hypothetical protein
VVELPVKIGTLKAFGVPGFQVEISERRLPCPDEEPAMLNRANVILIFYGSNLQIFILI